MLKPSVAGILGGCLVVGGGLYAALASAAQNSCQNLAQFEVGSNGCGGGVPIALAYVPFVAGIGFGIYALVQFQKAKPKNTSGPAAPLGPFAPPGWYPVQGMDGWFSWWDGATWGPPQLRSATSDSSTGSSARSAERGFAAVCKLGHANPEGAKFCGTCGDEILST